MYRRVIINADDFGLSESINQAVKQAHTDGVVTSTTIMANMPAATKAVRIARKLPDLGVGIHLNMTKGKPLSRNSGLDCLLNGDGSFISSPVKLSLLSITHKFRNALREELAAQIQWVIDNGIIPTHLDSHKHIHSFPPIFPIVCELAERFEIPAIRFTLEPKELLLAPWPMTGKLGRESAGKIRAMAKLNRIQNPSFFKTDALFGIVHIGKIDVNFFKAVALYNSVETVEIMTHPSIEEDPESILLNQRKSEFQALCNEKTKQYLDEAGIRLVHYGKL